MIPIRVGMTHPAYLHLFRGLSSCDMHVTYVYHLLRPSADATRRAAPGRVLVDWTLHSNPNAFPACSQSR